MAKKKAAKKMLRCGFASIIGRPNVGKSTLLNRIVGEKVAIVSPIPQTTRTAVKGIYNDERGQIIFIDTPGWHSGRDGLDRFMTRARLNALEGVDCIIHLVDTSKSVGEDETQIVHHLKGVKTPIILGLNKIDLKGKHFAPYLALWEETRKKKINEIENFFMIPLSGQEGTQVETLIDTIFSILPEGPLHYEPDIVADAPRRQVVADIVREKLFQSTRQELPHSIAVVIEEMRPVKGKTIHIRAVILVERDSQKEIVIGAKGQMLKRVGSLARADLEVLLESKVYLELYVKAKKNWRDNQNLLTDMGYIFESQ